MKVESIQIKNIKAQQDIILQKIFNLASMSTVNPAQVQQLMQALVKIVTKVEAKCTERQVTPANLTSLSRQIYAWMKFLTDEQNLHSHIQSTYRVRKIVKQTLTNGEKNFTEAMIEFTNLAGLYKGRRNHNNTILTINEGFIHASEEVLEALVKSAFLGKSQNSTLLIRSFASSTEYSNVLLELDLIAEVIAENPQGNFYNLNELFIKLNSEYFAAALSRPRLAWSQIKTYRKFGHYEPARDRVVMSLTLDDGNIPEFVTEFVLYHELLHKLHGIKWVNGRSIAHTPKFRAGESKFKLYKEAEEWLEKLASTERILSPKR
jgi:hypothetical protein